MTMAWRIYRGLAEAFPHEFKMAYGDEMVQAGEETMQQIARRHGVIGMARLIGDAALRLPLEYASEIRQDLRYAARSLKKSPPVGVDVMWIFSSLSPASLSTIRFAAHRSSSHLPSFPLSGLIHDPAAWPKASATAAWTSGPTW